MTLVGPKVAPGAAVTLTYAATVTTDASQGITFRHTMTGNATLAAPTSPTDNQMATREMTASGANRTPTLASAAGQFALGSDITAITCRTMRGLFHVASS